MVNQTVKQPFSQTGLIAKRVKLRTVWHSSRLRGAKLWQIKRHGRTAS